MKSTSTGIVLLLAVLVLSGCAVFRDKSISDQRADDLLVTFRRISSAPVEEQRRALTEATAEYEKSPSDSARIRLAMVLGMPGTPWRDDSRALQLLAGVDATRDSSVHDLAILFERLITARRDDGKRCDQKIDAIKDERKKFEQRAEAAHEECKKAELLQQQLDELRDIDRDLRNRRPTQRTMP